MWLGPSVSRLSPPDWATAMLRKIILRKLASEERRLGESLDYVRHILKTSLRAFFKFLKIMPLSAYRRKLPADAYHVAQIVAVRDEDCGTCVQIGINLALQDGVSADVLQAVIDDCPQNLPEPLEDVYRFTQSVVTADGDDSPLRDKMRGYYGEEGLVELALAIASCRVYPITKRAMGYATSCRLVEVSIRAAGVQ